MRKVGLALKNPRQKFDADEHNADNNGQVSMLD